MDNAAKAILIAGGVIIALLLMTIATSIWGKGSDAFSTIDERRVIALQEEQMVKLSQFVGDVYGSEVENCIRRVITYNYVNGTNIIVRIDNRINGVFEAQAEYTNLSNIIGTDSMPVVNLGSTYRNDIYNGTMITDEKGNIQALNFKKILVR